MTERNGRGIGRGVAELSVGTAFGQAAMLLLMPAVTRLFTPAEFGGFAIFLAVENMLGLIVAGRFDGAVPLPAEERDAGALSTLALRTSAGFALAAALAGVVAFGAVPGGRAVAGYLAAMPALLLFAGATQTMVGVANRRQRYREIAVAQSVQPLVFVGTAVVLGLSGRGSGEWLTAAYVIGQAAAATLLLVRGSSWLREHAGASGRGDLGEVARRYRAFPLANGPHALVDGVKESVVPVALGAAFGAASSGFFSLALRALRTPAIVVGQSVFKVLYRDSAIRRSDGRPVVSRVARVTGWLALAALPVYVIGWFLMPWLFRVVFGAEWVVAGEYARIMVPWLYLAFVATSVSFVPMLGGRQVQALGVSVVDLLLRLAAVAAGIAFGGPKAAVAWMTAGGCAVTAFTIVWYFHILSRPLPVGASAPVDDTASGAKRVILIGQGRWARRLAEVIERHGSGRWSATALPVDRVADGLALLATPDLRMTDVFVRVGMRPGASTWRGRGFDAMWRAVVARAPSARLAVYWVGTDVLNALSEGRPVPAATSGRPHTDIACAPWLVDELARAGVDAVYSNVPLTAVPFPEVAPPMPERFSVLTYVTDTRPGLYGREMVMEAARRLPDVTFRVMGAGPRTCADAPPNVQCLGYVDPAPEYADAAVVMRLMEHDGLGATVIEGLAHARHVIYTRPLPHTHELRFGDVEGLVATLEELRAAFEAGSLGPNAEGREWAMEEFDLTAAVMRFEAILDGEGPGGD